MEGSSLSQRKLFVVLNPRGGHADPAAVRQALRAHLRPPQWLCDIYEVTGSEDLVPVVRQAVEEGCHAVAAAGGDGTVSAAANGLVGTRVPLAILPVGTGNSMARELGLPLSLDRACALIAGAHQVRAIDLMKVGERYYCLNVSAGLSGQAMRDTTGESKHRYGIVAYVITALRALAGFQPRRFFLEIDGRYVSSRGSDVLVVNGTTPVHSLVRPGLATQLDDGRLGVYVIRARTLLDYAILAWVLVWGLERGDPRVRVYEATRSVTIQARPPAVVQGDGEGIGETPVTVSLVRQALRVIVPARPADTRNLADAVMDRVRRPGDSRLGD
ncbi:MAG: diacylglycerol kinase family lipid kinase [Anaerolineae bacterium]|nr:diacylglycerol kinase family lipid kinase [Anaerolineae bacterium]